MHGASTPPLESAVTARYLASATPERRGFVTASQQLLMQLTKLFYFDTEIADSCELFTPDVISNISVDDCSQDQ